MNEREFTKKIIKESGLTRRKVCALMGWKNVRSISQMMNQKSMSVQMLWRICEVFGYEIVVRKKNYLRLVEGEEIIEP